MGNGAKAQQKRERNDGKGKAEAKSQLKTNEAAMNKQCTICKQSFFATTNKKGMDEHASNKHSKTGKECFGAIYDESK
ncbi:hypothetical protein EMMF5_001868 [Cystobasidiomycetes sp. EMM_F5]